MMGFSDDNGKSRPWRRSERDAKVSFSRPRRPSFDHYNLQLTLSRTDSPITTSRDRSPSRMERHDASNHACAFPLVTRRETADIELRHTGAVLVLGSTPAFMQCTLHANITGIYS
jgi:hypothetical protein